MKKNNIEKKERIDNLESLDFEGDLSKTLDSLKAKIESYKKDGYLRFRVDKETEYDYCDPDGYIYHYLMGIRLETDKELEKRIADNNIRSKASKKAAKTKAIKKEENELKQYEKLHAKYKGKV